MSPAMDRPLSSTRSRTSTVRIHGVRRDVGGLARGQNNLVMVVGIARQEHEVEAQGLTPVGAGKAHPVAVEPFSEKLAERGWGRAPPVVTLEEGEPQGFRIVHRRWPVGVDPSANTERIINGRLNLYRHHRMRPTARSRPEAAGPVEVFLCGCGLATRRLK
jgi:hypothetical protein